AREARRARHGARQVLSKQEASAYRHGLLTLLRRVMTVSRRLRTRQRRARRQGKLEAELSPATTPLPRLIAGAETAIRTAGCAPASLAVTRLFVAAGGQWDLPPGPALPPRDGIGLRGGPIGGLPR